MRFLAMRVPPCSVDDFADDDDWFDVCAGAGRPEPAGPVRVTDHAGDLPRAPGDGRDPGERREVVVGGAGEQDQHRCEATDDAPQAERVAGHRGHRPMSVDSMIRAPRMAKRTAMTMRDRI